MTAAYMPFTYLSESTARLLTALAGPVVIYQPLQAAVPEKLTALASQGLVEIRTPMTTDDDRLRAALAEFTQWARMNPGKSTPGSGYFSARQGVIPFFDETTVNRIRSDIQRYHPSGPVSDEAETGFSARLFLAVAQENDLAIDCLDQDLDQFKAMERDFLEILTDSDETGFSRRGFGNDIRQEDPGARLTGQRIRAWATLAAADAQLPELLITTSPAVIEALSETHGDALGLEKLATLRISLPPAVTPPVMGAVLADLAARMTLSAADIEPFTALAADDAVASAVTVTLFAAANQPPARVIRQLAPASITLPEKKETSPSSRHTLLALVAG